MSRPSMNHLPSLQAARMRKELIDESLKIISREMRYLWKNLTDTELRQAFQDLDRDMKSLQKETETMSLQNEQPLPIISPLPDDYPLFMTFCDAQQATRLPLPNYHQWREGKRVKEMIQGTQPAQPDPAAYLRQMLEDFLAEATPTRYQSLILGIDRMFLNRVK